MSSVTTTIDEAGVGCAVFESSEIRAARRGEIVATIESKVGSPIEILGIRHLDGDGRDVDEPNSGGITIVGFRLPTSVEGRESGDHMSRPAVEGGRSAGG